MKRERKIRDLFVRSGNEKHYTTLRSEKGKRHTMKSAILLMVERDEFPSGHSLNNDVIYEIWWQARALDNGPRVFFKRLLLRLLDQNAEQLLRDEDGVAALARVARFSGSVVRQPETWQRRSRNPRQQLRSLVRHLFCRYAVPAFLDKVWQTYADEDYKFYTDLAWGVGVYGHKRLEKAAVSRKVAHQFRLAPDHCTINDAIRWAQVRAVDGSRALYRALQNSPLRNEFMEDAFWQEIIRWLARQPEAAGKDVGRIVRYIFFMKFGRFYLREHYVYRGAQEPKWKPKGRTLQSVLRDVAAWEKEMALICGEGEASWPAAPIPGYEWVVAAEGKRAMRTGRMVQILNVKDLAEEGKVMKHCVGTYVDECRSGESSIWSMREMVSGHERRLATIEIDHENAEINQARAKCNEVPDPEACERIAEWASLLGLKLQWEAFD